VRGAFFAAELRVPTLVLLVRLASPALSPLLATSEVRKELLVAFLSIIVDACTEVLVEKPAADASTSDAFFDGD
jgi:hypothetical protein